MRCSFGVSDQEAMQRFLIPRLAEESIAPKWRGLFEWIFPQIGDLSHRVERRQPVTMCVAWFRILSVR